MSPLGGFGVVLAPGAPVFHRYRYTELHGRVTLCGKEVTYWWQSSTEYRALVRFCRRHCSVCFPQGREGSLRGLQVGADG